MRHLLVLLTAYAFSLVSLSPASGQAVPPAAPAIPPAAWYEGYGWLWILLLIVIVACLVYYFAVTRRRTRR